LKCCPKREARGSRRVWRCGRWTGGNRSPLTIAVSRPGESVFSKVFLIRPSVFAGTPGVSAANADFSYPYAVEHAGKLYIGYTHKSHAANELAVVPIEQLRIEP
jgi:hypothetical protein